MKRNIYIIAGIIIYLCMGTIYSWSVFRKPLENIMGINATQSGYPYMVFLAMYAFSMPFAGRFIERIGPKFMTIIGGTIMSIGWLMAGFSDNIMMMTIAYGVIGGTGVGITYGVPLAVSAKWFPKNKGTAVGITLIGFGLSPFITAPIARYLIHEFGIFNTFKILGIIFLVIISALSILMKFPNQNWEKIEKERLTDENEEDIKPIQMVRKKEFVGLWSCYVIGAFTGLMTVGITSSASQDMIKLSGEQGALLVSILALFNGIGRPLFGYITDKFGVKKAAIITFLLIITASINLLVFGHTFAGFVAGFVLLWLILGGWLALAPAGTALLFGSKNYSENYGIVFTAYGVGAILGVYVSGKVKDIWGSYQYVFVITTIIAIIGILICLDTLNKKQKS